MSKVRDCLLAGVAGASEAHGALRLREATSQGARAIDVFEVIARLDIPLRFAPLDKLLGACMRVDDVTVGILITTQRDLHLQRFTAAHELGHFVLQHEGSLDREAPRVPVMGRTRGRDPAEVEADAFAAEFLMPKWLIGAVANRHGWWSASALSKPDVVYQLSLRLAVSYEATCWGLASQSCVPVNVAERLVETPPKASKQKVLSGTPLDDPWADVWSLDSGDNGAVLDAGPNDLLVLTLREQASAGYCWDTDRALDSGFVILSDDSDFDTRIVGGESSRRIVFRVPPSGVHELSLSHRRRFDSEASPTATFSASVSTIGSRREGSYMAAEPSGTVVH